MPAIKIKKSRGRPTAQKMFPHHVDTFFGVNYSSPYYTSKDILSREAQDFKNVMLGERDGFDMRPGRAKGNGSHQLPTYIHSMFWFVDKSETDRLLLGAGAKIYDDGDAVGNPTEVYTGLTADLHAFGCPFAGFFFWANGVDQPLKYDGSDWSTVGIAKPTVAPVLASGGAGALTGTYRYMYCYLYENAGLGYEAESTMSEEAELTAAAEQITVTVTETTNTSCTAIRIYRISNTSVEWLLLAEVANVTAPYTDNTPDPLSGGAIISIYEGQPPALEGICEWRNRLWGWKDTLVYNTKKDSPEKWYLTTSKEHVPFGTGDDMAEKVLLCHPHGEMLIVFTSHTVKAIVGTEESNFRMITLFQRKGLASRRSVATTGGLLRFLAYDGLNVWNGVDREPVIVSDPVEQDFQGLNRGLLEPTSNTLALACALYLETRKQYWISHGVGSDLYNSRCLVDFLKIYNQEGLSTWGFYSPIYFEATCTAPDNRVFTASRVTGDAGYYYRENYGTQDNGVDIEWLWRSRAFNMESGSMHKQGLFIDVTAYTLQNTVTFKIITDFGEFTDEVTLGLASQDQYDVGVFDTAVWAGIGKVAEFTSCQQNVVGEYIDFEITGTGIGGMHYYEFLYNFKGRRPQ